MKKTLLALALLAAAAAAHAQEAAPAAAAAATAAAAAPAGYAELLAQTIEASTHTGDPAVLAEQAARLERAATMRPTDWLPRYYQAYALILQARLGKTDGASKDQLLDRAETALGQAQQLKGDASELAALQAMGYQMRLSIAPMQRYEQYGELVLQALDLAKTLNPANPRAYLIEGNQLYYTPEMYGGGPAAARPLYDTAKAKFAAFRPASPLAPAWGESQLLGRLKTYEAGTAAATAH